MSTILSPETAEKLFKNSVQIRQGFEGMMLDKISRQNEEVFNLAKQTREGTLGKPLPSDSTKANDMGVSVGNETHITNIYGSDYPNGQAARTAPEDKTPAPVAPTETKSDPTPIQPLIIQPIVTSPTADKPTDSAPVSAPASSGSVLAPLKRSGLLGPTLAALAVGGGALLGHYLTKTPTPPQGNTITVEQPNRPDTTQVKPEIPVQPNPGQPGWSLGANPYKPDAQK